MARALITGLSGQDGSYMAELLLDEGYEVHGLVRNGLGSAAHLGNRVSPHVGDLRDAESVQAAVRDSAPDAVYHFGAVTHVADSEVDPAVVRDVVVGGSDRLLAAVADAAPQARVFCAS